MALTVTPVSRAASPILTLATIRVVTSAQEKLGQSPARRQIRDTGVTILGGARIVPRRYAGHGACDVAGHDDGTTAEAWSEGGPLVAADGRTGDVAARGGMR